MSVDIHDLIGPPNSVYSLPSIHIRLNEKLKDPYSANAEIANLIEKDPGLSLVVLKIVNSAIYGFRQSISTITQAVNLLGRNELSILLLSTGVISLFKKLSIKQELLTNHWQHSLLCGLIAKQLSLQGNLANDSQSMFMAGLLHDLGKPVIWHKLPELSKTLYDEINLNDSYDHELSLLGFSHAEVGYELMKSWGLPENLQTTVLFHHNADKADQYVDWCKLIELSNLLAHRSPEISITAILASSNSKLSEAIVCEAIQQSQILLADTVKLYLG
jgi:putative nucleotidyltransferase with HDIG domain